MIKMTVYVLIWSLDIETKYTLGVFSSKEKADAATKRLIEKKTNYYSQDDFDIMSFVIDDYVRVGNNIV